MSQSARAPRPSHTAASTRRRGAISTLALALAGALASPAALAQVDTDAIADLLTEQGSAGLGFLYRFEESPYVDAGQRSDLLPLYLYEGERVFINADRAGIKLVDDGSHRVDTFLSRRLEGVPLDDVPDVVYGMTPREAGGDLGVRYRYSAPWGTVRTTVLHEVTGASGGRNCGDRVMTGPPIPCAASVARTARACCHASGKRHGINSDGAMPATANTIVASRIERPGGRASHASASRTRPGCQARRPAAPADRAGAGRCCPHGAA